MIAKQPRHAPCRVLVVDDEPQVRDLLRTTLEVEGYRAEIAANVDEARTVLERGGIDLMLLDLMLPRVDGFTLLEQLRDEPKLRPAAILVLSALTQRENVLRALELGANDYLTKPFNVDDLLVRVEMWLSRSREISEEDRRAREATLSMYTFGLFRVQRGETPLIDESFGYRKAKTLLKYLVTHHGQRVPKERLIDLLWPDLDEEAGSNNLHGAIHVLRRALDSETKEQYIVHTGGFFYFNADAPHWWDVHAFRAHLGQAATAEQRGDAEAAIGAYASALALYIGHYLEEDLYEDWTVPMREALREEWLGALTRMAALQGERGAYDDAITLLKKVQREDPFREQTYRDLMCYLYRAGRRPEAVQLYRTAAELFHAELGIEPMQATREIYERLVRGEAL